MKHYSNSVQLGNLDLQGNELQNSTLPDDSSNMLHAKPGRLARIFNRLLFCVGYEIPNDPSSPAVWAPLLQEKSAYIHSQTDPSTEWTITHNFNTSRVLVQVWDSESRVVGFDSVEVLDPNTVKVTLINPIMGYAVVMSGTFDGVEKPGTRFEQEFTDQTVITVAHGLGYEPMIRVLNTEGLEVLPESVQHTSVNNALVTMPASMSGKVICM